MKLETSLLLRNSRDQLYFRPPENLDSHTNITIDDHCFRVEADDIKTVRVIGQGAYGTVEKVIHRPTGTVMAVKVSLLIKIFHEWHNCLVV